MPGKIRKIPTMHLERQELKLNHNLFLKPDGTWTDVPRCIEHEPGKDEQIPGRCPGIPGYCSDDTTGKDK